MYFFYFYPVGVDIKRRRRPVLTAALAAFMTAVFLWARYGSDLFPVHPTEFIFFPGNDQPWTVLTAVFLHFDWLHFLGNMVYLIVLAPLIEDRLGRGRLLYYFLVLGAGGNLAHGLASMSGWLSEPGVGVVGASGAIAGLLALTLVRFYFARIALAYWVFTPLQGINRAGRAYVPIPAAVLLWLLLQVVQGLVATESGTRVAYAAHLGGFGLGLILAFLLGCGRQAKAERSLVQGCRFLAQGQAFAAEGAFLEYLRLAPEDREGWLQLARARRLSGRFGDARADYRRAFRLALHQGDIHHALAVYQEARRGDAMSGLPPEELAKAAFLMEKQLDFQGAAEAYVDLFTLYPTDKRAELAIVRAIMLFQAKLGRYEEAKRWLAVAWRQLPPSVWRDFLAKEFRLERTPREAISAEGPSIRTEPAV
jgi:membrane associated rhomboid family serine protease